MLKKIVAVITLVSFLATNSSFALAPQTRFSGYESTEFKEAAQIQIGIRSALNHAGILQKDSIRSLGIVDIAENSVVFKGRTIGKIYFNDAREARIPASAQDKNVRNYIVKANTNTGDWYCLVSCNISDKSYQITVLPERAFDETASKGAIKFTHDDVSDRDRQIIDGYIQHETSFEHGVSTDEFIAPKMVDGRYAVDDRTAATNALYSDQRKAIYPQSNYQSLLKSITAYLKAAGARKENIREVLSVMTSTPLVFIPYKYESELPLVTVKGTKIIVTAHSSQFATYIFIKEEMFNAIKEGKWTEEINKYIERELLHEIGARCGMRAELWKDMLHNILDKYFDLYVKAGRPEKMTVRGADLEEIINLAPVNLNELEYRSDYFEGYSPVKGFFKSIMKISILLAVVAICGIAVRQYMQRPPITIVQKSEKELSKEAEALISQLIEARTKEDKELLEEKMLALVNIGRPAVPQVYKAYKEKRIEYIIMASILQGIGGEQATAMIAEGLKSSNGNEKFVALQALIFTGDRSAVPPIIELAKDKSLDLKSKRNVIKALGMLGDGRAIPVLNEMLSVPDIREDVITALAETRDDQALPILTKLVETEKDKRALWAIYGLHTNKALSYLHSMLTDKKFEDMQFQVACYLAETGDRDTFPVLLKYLKADNAYDPEKAAEALCNLNDERVIQVFIEVLKDKALPEVRNQAIRYLSMTANAQAHRAVLELLQNKDYSGPIYIVCQHGGKWAVPILIKALDSKDKMVREAAAIRLGDIGDKRVIPDLIRKMGDPESAVRHEALIALAELKAEELASLSTKAIKDDSDINLRIEAAKYAGKSGDKQALADLRELLKAKDMDTRAIAAQGLAYFGDKESIPDILKLLTEKDKTRLQENICVTSLWMLGEEDKVATFNRALEGGDKKQQLFAIGILKNIDTEKALLTLLAAYKDHKIEVREAVVKALGHRKDIGSYPFLIKALKDENHSVRVETAKAIANIGGSSFIPALKDASLNDRCSNVRLEAEKALMKIERAQREKEMSGEEPKKSGALDDNDRADRVAESMREPVSISRRPGLIKKALGISIFSAVAFMSGYAPSAKAGEEPPKPPTEQVDEALNDNVKALLEKLGADKRGYAETINSLTTIGKPAVPALIRAIKDNNSRVRGGAIFALGLIGDKQAVPAIIKALKDGDMDVRILAARALGELGDKQAIPALTEALKDENFGYRIIAATALGRLGNKEGLDILNRALKNEDIIGRLLAAEGLSRIGDKQGLAILIEALKNNESDVRGYAATTLGELGNKQAVPALIEALKDKEVGVQRVALRSLVKLGDTRAVPALIEILKDENARIRGNIALALGDLGDKQAVPALIEALKSKDSQLRGYSAIALGQLGDKQAVPALIEALKDEDLGVRLFTCESLTRLGDERPVPVIIKMLKDEDPRIRGAAAKALGLLGFKQAVPDLVKALKDDERLVRLVVAEALARLGDKQGSPILIEALKDENADVRKLAKEALAKIQKVQEKKEAPKEEPRKLPVTQPDDAQKAEIRELVILAFTGRLTEKEGMAAVDKIIKIGKPAVPVLIEMLKSKDDNVRLGAAILLGGVGDKEAIPALVEAIGDPNSSVALIAIADISKLGDRQAVPLLSKKLEETSGQVQNAVAEAICHFGGKDAVGIFVKALEPESKVNKMTAAQLLGRIGGEEAIKALTKLSKDKDKNVRAIAVFAMGDLDDKRTVPILIELLKDENSNVRCAAARTLGTFNDVQAIPALIESLADTDGRVQVFAAESLAKLGDKKAMSALEEIARNEGGDIQIQTLLALGQLGDQRTADALNVIAQKLKMGMIKMAVIDTLGKLKSKEAVPFLVESLGDGNALLRGGAAIALGRIGDKRAIDALRGLLEDRDRAVRVLAYEALGRLGDKQDDEAVRKEIRDGARENRAIAARAIYQSSKLDGIGKLIELLQDKDYAVRREAAKDLGELAEEAGTEIARFSGDGKPSEVREAFDNAEKALRSALNDDYSFVRRAVGEAIIKIQKAQEKKEAPKETPKEEPKKGSMLNDDRADKVADVLWDASTGVISKDDATQKLDELMPAKEGVSEQTKAAVTSTLLSQAGLTALSLSVKRAPKNGRMSTFKRFITLSILSGLALIGGYSQSAKAGEGPVGPATEQIDETTANKIKALIADFESKDMSVSYKAKFELFKIGKPAVSFLVEAAKSKSDMTRCNALIVLGNIEDERALPVVIGAVSDAKGPIRAIAIEALGKFKKEENTPILIKALQDKDIFVIMKAIEGLKMAGDERALAPLAKLQDHKDETIRRYVKQAIERIKEDQKAQEKKEAPKEEPKKGTMLNNDRADKVADVLWKSSTGVISKDDAERKIDELVPTAAGVSGSAKSAVIAGLVAGAGLAMTGMAKNTERMPTGISDEDIRAVAAKLKDSNIEIYMPASQLPDSLAGDFRRILEKVFADRLKTYQNIEDIAGVIKNPDRAIVMTVDLTDNQVQSLEKDTSKLEKVRFMNFEKMDMEGMTQLERENYLAETISMLLIARSMTKNEAEDRSSRSYRLLAHLLEDRMQDKTELDNYIRSVSNDSINPINRLRYVLKTILKAIPVTAYKLMRHAVEVLWAA